MKTYPGFVNYFEIIKETIIRCDKEKPRFHAFLKVIMSSSLLIVRNICIYVIVLSVFPTKI